MASEGVPPGLPGVLLPTMPTKQLTAAIKGCTSQGQLAALYATHQGGLNPIHIAAMITKLPKLDAAAAGGPASSATPATLRQLLQQLLAQLALQGCSHHGPRGVANILWALARLQCAPDAQLRGMLLERFCAQLEAAVPQDVSNVLWGVAKLTKERAAVLASPLGSSIGAGAGADGPLLSQAQVKLLLQQLCAKLPAASVQTISNSLWAVVVLQQEHAWCMCNCLPEVRALLTALCEPQQQAAALPGHIQPTIRCMAQLATTCSSHAGDSWIAWQPPLLQRLLEQLCSQREQMELHHVTSVLRDVAQVVCLQLLCAKLLQDKKGSAPAAGGGGSMHHAPSSSSSSSLGWPAAAGGGEALGGGGSIFGLSSSSSAASSSSSMLGSHAAGSQQQLGGSVSGFDQDAEQVLVRLAASGGPTDATSTVVALAMLRPFLQQLGLQAGVAGLAAMLPSLPNLAPDVGQKLLAATSAGAPVPLLVCAPVAYGQQGSAAGGVLLQPASGGSPSSNRSSDSDLDSPRASGLPVSCAFAADLFAQRGAGSLPPVPVPVASPCSSSTSSGAASPTQPGSLLEAALAGAGSPPAAAQPSLAAGGQQQQQAAVGVSQGGDSLSGSGGAGAAAAAAAYGATHNASSELLLPEVRQQGVPPVAAAASTADSQEEAAARQLTHNIAYADSVFQLADIFTAHASVMDMIHITACITRLSKVLGTSPSPAAQAAASALLPMLGAKLQAVLPHANARGIANVLWGYGRLRNLPQADLLPPLLEAFLKQLGNAACRDSAVVLWSLARLAEGQRTPQAVGVQPPLLRRLGRELLQQIANAAQLSSSGGGGAALGAAQQAAEGLGGPAAVKPPRQPGEPGEGPEPSAPPSSRDVSNSLMALARLGFLPEAESSSSTAATPKAAAEPQPAATAPEQDAAAVAGDLPAAMEGLKLQGAASSSGPSPTPAGEAAAAAEPAPEAAAAAASSVVRLTLPLSSIKALVDYLLSVAATAKTLDLQETATALKQLGLRDMQALVAAAIVAHHGTGHPGPGQPAGLHLMHMGGQGQGGYAMLRPGPPYMAGRGGMLGQQMMPGLMQQRRPQQPNSPGYPGGAGGGWVPAHGGGMLRPGSGGGLLQMQAGSMGGVPGPPGLLQQQQLMQGAPAGSRQGGMLGGVHSLAGGQPGGGVMYGGSPGSYDVQAGGYGAQYGAAGAAAQPDVMLSRLHHQQQQQQAVYMRSAAVGGGMQYLLMPQQQQQQQQQVGAYMMPQQQQQQQGGLSALQQQQQAQYMLLPTSAPGFYGAEGVPGPSWVGGAPAGVGGQQAQQLVLQQPGGLGGLDGYGAGGDGAYQALGSQEGYGQAGSVLPAGGYLPAAAGGQPQLHMLQQQPVGGLCQQQQAPRQLTGLEAGMFMQQPQQGVAYGAGQVGPGQQQLAVVDPTTGLYQFQP